MTTTSVVPAVIDWLVNAAGNNAKLGEATPAVIVIDGPEPTKDTLTEPLHLWIGYDAQAQGGPGAEATQDWPVMDHARTRDEDGEIICTADAWSGDLVMKTQRDACAAIVAAVELLLRGDILTSSPGDATMGGLVQWSGVAGPYVWEQRQTQQGAGCSCVFKVTYRARLVTS